MAQEVLGRAALPFRATLFDKSPTPNWLVVWHQDTALPLCERNVPRHVLHMKYAASLVFDQGLTLEVV